MSEAEEPMVEVPVARLQWMRERIAELEAGTARLQGELDLKDANHNTILCVTAWIEQAQRQCRGEEPGTVLRETDGQRREWVLGDDQEWHER